MEFCQFSILMPNFNNGTYIKEAILSVLSQTVACWELIIIDDASSDNSVDVIIPFLKDNRIKLFRNSFNKGVSSSTRKLVEESRAPFFGILDSDDVLAPNAVEKMLEAHELYKDAGMIYSQFYYCDYKLNIQKTGFCARIPFHNTALRLDIVGHFRTFKKAAYMTTSGLDPNLYSAEDKDLIYKIEEKFPLHFIDVPLYYYRVQNQSLSQGGNKILSRLYKISAVLNAFKRRKKLKILNLNDAEMVSILYKGIGIAFRAKKPGVGIELLLEAVRIKKRFPGKYLIKSIINGYTDPIG